MTLGEVLLFLPHLSETVAWTSPKGHVTQLKHAQCAIFHTGSLTVIWVSDGEDNESNYDSSSGHWSGEAAIYIA